MRRVMSQLPLIALGVASALLFYGSLHMRDSASARRDREARQAFAISVQRGERPGVATTNMGGVLRQELDAQASAAATRSRVATWLQLASVLTLVGLMASLKTRVPERNESSVAAA